MPRSISKAIVATLVALVMALCLTSPSLAFGGAMEGSEASMEASGAFVPGSADSIQGLVASALAFDPASRADGFSSIGASSAMASG